MQNLMRGQNCKLGESDIDKIGEITEGYSGADMWVLSKSFPRTCIFLVHLLEFRSMILISLHNITGKVCARKRAMDPSGNVQII